MIDGSPSQHHGVIIGPFGSVAPPLLVAVPEVAAGRVSDDAVWKTLPHCEGKVDLDPNQREKRKKREPKKRVFKRHTAVKMFWFFFSKSEARVTDLCGRKHSVLIQTEDSIGGDGVVGKKATAYHLVGFKK